MEPKICMITGANSGIGKAAALQLAQQGHHVIMACRNQQRGEAALDEIREISKSDQVELMIVDMGLQSSVRELAASFLGKYNRLDVLIQNAAVFDITQKTPQVTSEGIESIWTTNHLGPVMLTELLWDALQVSVQGRVITIASKGLIAKPFLKVDIDDPEFKNRKFSVENAYYQSKLAQIVFTLWLAEKGKLDGITANCISVPAVRVDIERFIGMSEFMKKAYALKSKFALSPEEMAAVYVHLALSDDLTGVSGNYFDEKLVSVKLPRFAREGDNVERVMNLTRQYLGGKA